jgi:hydrocephalus-inducing protein
MLKNDGLIPATIKFDLSQQDGFRFLSTNTLTISPKSYSTFRIDFQPTTPGQKQWLINYETLLNQYENNRIMVQGEAYQEDLIFEGLPD